MFEGKEEFVEAINYEERVGPTGQQYHIIDTGKANARKTLRQHCGEKWKDEFDSQQYHLWQFSEHFL